MRRQKRDILVVLIMVIVTVAFFPPLYAQLDTTWVEKQWNISPKDGVASDSLGRLVLDQIPEDENLALKKTVTTIEGMEIKRVTDGKTLRYYWDSRVAEALGLFLKIDLEQIRLLNRIRILPLTLKTKPVEVDSANFIKGYSIRLSQDDVVYKEVLLNLFNTNPIVDTTFTPTLARYVKVVVAAVDNINKVWISEIELYGKGYVNEGSYVSPVLDFGTSDEKNFGLIQWKADIPEETQLSLQFRTGRTRVPPTGWSDWSPAYTDTTGILFPALEPRRYFQYQVNFTSSHPGRTPVLKELTIYYSTSPLAYRAKGSIVAVKDTLPHQVPVGKEMDYIYTVTAQFNSKSIGFNKLGIFTPVRSQIIGVDTNGVALTAGVEYEDKTTDEEITLLFKQPIKSKLDSLRVHFRTTLFLDQNVFSGYLAHTELSPTNPQYLEENTTGGRSWTILTSGYIGNLLEANMVRVAPNPFSPNGDGLFDETKISFAIAKLSTPRRVSVKIFDLSGTVVWKQDLLEKAGLFEVTWNGKDVDGNLLPPGLYIYQIDVDADEPTRPVSGTVVIAY